MGVPSLGCHCRVCRSQDPHDNRTRPSVLVSREDHHVVIDTTPDFRFQALRQGLESLDAIVYTHGHADHILGFDDIRPFNLRQKSAVPIYASQETWAILQRTFAYVFDGTPAPSTIPEVTPHVIEGPFELLGTPWKRSEEHTSELQSRLHLVCRLLLEKKKKKSHAQRTRRSIHGSGLHQ